MLEGRDWAIFDTTDGLLDTIQHCQLAHRVPKKYPSSARSQEVEGTTSSTALANVGCRPERASPILKATPGSQDRQQGIN